MVMKNSLDLRQRLHTSRIEKDPADASQGGREKGEIEKPRHWKLN